MKSLSILLLSVWIAASANVSRLPEEFIISERYLSLSRTFDISTDFEPLAIARKRFLSLTTAFDLEDPNGLMIARTESKFLSWGTTADVIAPLGQKIGSIEEEIFQFFSWSKYRIYNFENHLVAIAQMNFFGTEFNIYNPINPEEIYATIHRPFFRCFRDYWTVQIKNYPIFEEQVIDPRLLITLAIYQTEEDIRKRALFESIFRYDQEYYDNRRYE